MPGPEEIDVDQTLDERNLVGRFDVIRKTLDARIDPVRQLRSRAMRVFPIGLRKVGDGERFTDPDERVSPELAAWLELQADGKNAQVQIKRGCRLGLEGDACRSGLERRKMGFVLRDPFWKDRDDLSVSKQARELLEGTDVAAHPLPIVLRANERNRAEGLEN